MILPTVFLTLHSDLSDAIRYLYLLEEEGHKRRDDCIKYSNSVLNRTDQVVYIR